MNPSKNHFLSTECVVIANRSNWEKSLGDILGQRALVTDLWPRARANEFALPCLRMEINIVLPQMKLVAKKVLKVQAGKEHAAAVDEVSAKVSHEMEKESAAAEWSEGVDIGRACRMIDEKIPSTFGAPAKVVGQQGTKIKLEVEGVFHSVVCEESQVDWLPQLVASPPKLALKLTNLAKNELCHRFPDIDTLQMNDRLSGDHIMLGSWILSREIERVPGADLLPPMVVVSYCTGLLEKGPDGAACKDKAQEIIRKRRRRSGLLGVPVWSPCDGPGSEHWTLLILRRCGDALQVRYYDSATEVSPTNLSSADLVMQLVCADMKIEPMIIERCNHAKQMDGTSCGVFVLHWWEGEIRRFRGEGWPLLYPWGSGAIKDRKKRLVGLVSQILKHKEDLKKAAAEPADGKAKKKMVAEPIASEVLTEDREASGLNTEELKMLDMKKLAEAARDQGLVTFYGCSRCRFSRGGCISWNCNPDKYTAHRAKFPEKYEGQILKLPVADSELVGGGGGQARKVITLARLKKTYFYLHYFLLLAITPPSKI